jgi:hypothetical protein
MRTSVQAICFISVSLLFLLLLLKEVVGLVFFRLQARLSLFKQSLGKVDLFVTQYRLLSICAYKNWRDN